MNRSIDKITNGWLETARQIPSPNCDERPEGEGIDLLVVHGISLPAGEYGKGYIDALFTNELNPESHPSFCELCNLKVSAHLVIYRNGDISQFVPFHLRAWHAGESCYEERSGCNDFSIGIELEGTDDEAYETAQYESLAGVIRILMRHYPGITRERITGHSDIAPQRKTDPGRAFDWQRLYTLLEQVNTPLSESQPS